MILDRKDYDNIICNKYIPLVVRHPLSSHVDFAYEGILETYPDGLDKRRFTGVSEDIVKYIREAVNDGWYVVTSANEYYLEGKMMSGIRYFRHDIMISDYDDAARTFKTIGYDASGHYRESEVSYNSMNKAYYSLQNEWEFETSLFKINDRTYDIDIDRIRYDLSQYLDADNPVTGYLDEFIAG